MWYRRRANKYGNNKVVADGQTFASRKEANRYYELKLLEKAGSIKDLATQVKFVLIPAQREPDTQGARGGKLKGKLIERECAYLADFCYTDTVTGQMIVEDTKGMKTKEYIIKRKLMLYLLGIRIKEV